MRALLTNRGSKFQQVLEPFATSRTRLITSARREAMRIRRCAIALVVACGLSGVVFTMPDHDGSMGTRGNDVYCQGWMEASSVPTGISIWLWAPNGALIDSSFMGQSGNKSLLVEAAGAKVGSGTYDCHIEFDGGSDFDELDLHLNVS
jgi:hypothetical protein